jgi:hypothetical protein
VVVDQSPLIMPFIPGDLQKFESAPEIFSEWAAGIHPCLVNISYLV